MANKIIYFRCW